MKMPFHTYPTSSIVVSVGVLICVFHYGQAASFVAAPNSLAEQGKAILQELDVKAGGETWLHWLLGTDCYTQALLAMNKECRAMGEEERARLAFGMTRCFLTRASNVKPPDHCPDGVRVAKCTENMDDRAFNAYTQFYTNIHTVCLYIQNQNFIKQAEEMTRSLHGAGMVALGTLHAVGSNLTAQTKSLQDLGDAMGEMRKEQVQVAQAVGVGLEGLQLLLNHTAGLQLALGRSLSIQEALEVRQHTVAAGLAELAAAETDRAAASTARWQAAELAAATLMESQARASELMASLGDASTALAARTAGVAGMLETVLAYERRSDALLTYMLGSSYTLSDVLYHGAAAAVIALGGNLMPGHTGTVVQSMRLPLAGLLGAGLVAERGALRGAAHLLQLDPSGQVALPVGTSPLRVNLRTLVRCVTALLGLWLVVRRSRAVREEQRSATAVIASLEARLAAIQQQQLIIMRAVCPEAAPRPEHDEHQAALAVVSHPAEAERLLQLRTAEGQRKPVTGGRSTGGPAHRKAAVQPEAETPTCGHALGSATPRPPAMHAHDMQQGYPVAAQSSPAHAIPAQHPIALLQLQTPLPLEHEFAAGFQALPVAAPASSTAAAGGEGGGEMEVDGADANMSAHGARAGKRKRGIPAAGRAGTAVVAQEEESEELPVEEDCGVAASGRRGARTAKPRTK